MSDPAPQKPRFRPETFGKFLLFAPIATGGMGEVFLARMAGESGFERLVVIKRILPHLTDKKEFVDMFVDEARVAAQIHHPNVCQILEFGQIEGRYYMALEYLEGISLTQVIVGGRKHSKLRDLRFLISLMSQTCEGLHFAHNLRTPTGALARVVHRDVNPKNIFITSAGVSKVIDFGIVKALGAINVTRAGSVKGTYSYMSPEQIKATDVDRRSDVFSLGTVTWEAVTGVRLFKRENDFHTWRAITEDPIPPPSQFREGLPPALDAVLLKALERDRENRFATARDLAVALEEAIGPQGGPLTPVAVAARVERSFHDEIEMQRKRAIGPASETEDVPDNWEGLTEVDHSVTPSAQRARPELFDNSTSSVGAGAPVGSQPITGSGPAALFGDSEPSSSDGAVPLTASASDISARRDFGPTTTPSSEAAISFRPPSSDPDMMPTGMKLQPVTEQGPAAPRRRKPIVAIVLTVFLLGVMGLSAFLYLTRQTKEAAGNVDATDKPRDGDKPGTGAVVVATSPDASVPQQPAAVDAGVAAVAAPDAGLTAEQLEERRRAEEKARLKAEREKEKLEKKERREKERREKEKERREKEKREKEKREKEAREAASKPPGFVNVSSKPFGTVYIDGKGYGPTPLVRKKLPPGKHTVKVVSSVDGTKKSRTVTITSGKVSRVKIEF